MGCLCLVAAPWLALMSASLPAVWRCMCAAATRPLACRRPCAHFLPPHNRPARHACLLIVSAKLLAFRPYHAAALSNQESLKERKLGALHQALAMYRSRLGLEFVHGAGAAGPHMRADVDAAMRTQQEQLQCGHCCSVRSQAASRKHGGCKRYTAVRAAALASPAAGEGDGEQLRCIFTQVSVHSPLGGLGMSALASLLPDGIAAG